MTIIASKSSTESNVPELRFNVYVGDRVLSNTTLGENVYEMSMTVLEEELNIVGQITGMQVNWPTLREKLESAVEAPGVGTLRLLKADVFIIASLGEKVIGSCTLKCDHEYTQKSVRIGNVYIVPEHRRHGYATRMMMVAIETAKETWDDVVMVSLNVLEGQQAPEALYRALGFSPIRTTMMKLL